MLTVGRLKWCGGEDAPLNFVTIWRFFLESPRVIPEALSCGERYFMVTWRNDNSCSLNIPLRGVVWNGDCSRYAGKNAEGNCNALFCSIICHLAGHSEGMKTEYLEWG
jgi:hypothetical protein